MWKNDHIVSLIAQNRNVILPIIFEPLERNVRSHWNQAVHGLTINVRKMFLEMDFELFEECQKQHDETEAKAQELEEQRELTWKRLAEAAEQWKEEDGITVWQIYPSEQMHHYKCQKNKEKMNWWVDGTENAPFCPSFILVLLCRFFSPSVYILYFFS